MPNNVIDPDTILYVWNFIIIEKKNCYFNITKNSSDSTLKEKIKMPKEYKALKTITHTF